MVHILEVLIHINAKNTTSRNGNRSVIRSASFHHVMFPYQYACLGKNNTFATAIQQIFHNDSVWAAADNLLPGSRIGSEQLRLQQDLCNRFWPRIHEIGFGDRRCQPPAFTRYYLCFYAG